MNLLDAVILAFVVAAAAVGYRLGFVARALSWAGLAAGVALAVVFLPDVTDALGRTEPRTRLIAALAFVVGVTLVGQAIGLAVGGLIHARVLLPPRLAATDRAAGAALGAAGVLLLVWLAIPALATAPGWPARAARGSAIVREVDRVAPSPPRALEALARQVGATGPEVLGRLAEPPDTGSPPSSGLAAPVDALARASTVKVEGPACDTTQDGSGFAVAPDLVVTNAHVIAGDSEISVETPDGGTHDARAVAIDPARDLALLSVPRLGLAPLPLGRGRVGTVGAVYGHPEGGALTASPARVAELIRASGRDIYGERRTERDVFVIAAVIRPGNSGGPLVDAAGKVIGVAFAIDPGRPGTAYALADTELRAVLDGPRGSVDTGSCVAG